MIQPNLNQAHSPTSNNNNNQTRISNHSPSHQTYQPPSHHRSNSLKNNNFDPALDHDHGELPAQTDTEKVNDAQAGWEMWVADENLMNELGGRHHHYSHPSTKHNINSTPPISTTTTTTPPNHLNKPKPLQQTQQKPSSLSALSSEQLSTPSSDSHSSPSSSTQQKQSQSPQSKTQPRPHVRSIDFRNQTNLINQFNKDPQTQLLNGTLTHSPSIHSAKLRSNSQSIKTSSPVTPSNNQIPNHPSSIQPSRNSSTSSSRPHQINPKSSTSYDIALPSSYQHYRQSPDPQTSSFNRQSFSPNCQSTTQDPRRKSIGNRPSVKADTLDRITPSKSYVQPNGNNDLLKDQHNGSNPSKPYDQSQAHNPSLPNDHPPYRNSKRSNHQPSLKNQNSHRSPSPYAYAYEVYDRHVSRVPPATVYSRQNTSSTPLPATFGPSHARPAPPSKPQPTQEVCVECMMRDRDMADVDVVGPAVWSRKSDADFEEAMAAELAMDEHESTEQHSSKDDHIIHPSSSSRLRASFGRSSSGGEDLTIDESVTNGNNNRTYRHRPGGLADSRRGSPSKEDSPNYHGSDSIPSTSVHKSKPRRRPIGFGNPLTCSALKAWTQMNPPASSHRWKTLQLYLKEQRHYLEMEHKAKLTAQLENDRTEQIIRKSLETNQLRHEAPSSSTRQDYNFLNTVPAAARGRTSNRGSSTATLLPNGLVLETLDVSQDEKEAAKHWVNETKHRQPLPTKRVSSSSVNRSILSQQAMSPPHQNHPATDILQYSPAPPHSAHLNYPSSPSTRAPSPSRFSIASRRSGFAESMRPFSTWSRNRRSGSNSIFSFAPSGSMVEMHVGLSQDRHHHSNQQGYLSPQNTGYVMTGPDSTNYESLSNSPSQFNSNVGQPNPTDSKNFTQTGSGRKDKKKLKHTFKGLLVKLGLGRRRSTSSIDPIERSAAQMSGGSRLGLMTGGAGALHPDDEPLAPPPSLSVLAREQQNHRRNTSALSLPLSTVAGGGRRSNGFRPQSISTVATGGMVDSALSSPVSQFAPSSPGLNPYQIKGGASPYMDPNSPHLDSLAEELNMSNLAPSSYSSSPPQQNYHHGRMRGKSTSSATGSNLPSMNQDGVGWVGPQNQRMSKSHHDLFEVYQGDCDSRNPSRQSGQVQDKRLSKSPKPDESPSVARKSMGLDQQVERTRERSESIKTVMSKSSKFRSLISLPGFRKSTSSILNLANHHNPNSTERSADESNRNSRRRSRSLASSTRSSSIESATVRTENETLNQANGDCHHSKSRRPRLDQNSHSQPMPLARSSLTARSSINNPHQVIRKRENYLPIEKTRQAVSRSSDFLALRYVSLAPDT